MTSEIQTLSRIIEHMSTFFRVAAVAATVFLAVAAPALAKKRTEPTVEGIWDTPAGRLELKRQGDRTGGVLLSALAGVDIKTPKLVLNGTFYEDNVTAEVHLGLVVPECGDTDKKAFVLLLLTRSGKLTGGLSTKEPCAAGVTSVTFVRSANQENGPAVRLAGEKNSGQAADAAAVDAAMHEALALMQAGRFEGARKVFMKIIKRAPTRGEAYNGAGVTYAMRNEWREAIDWYKKGLEAQPGFADLYYNLACAYSRLDKTAMALRYLKLSASRGWTDLEVMEADPDLAPVRASEGFAEIRSLLEASAEVQP